MYHLIQPWNRSELIRADKVGIGVAEAKASLDISANAIFQTLLGISRHVSEKRIPYEVARIDQPARGGHVNAPPAQTRAFLHLS